MSTHGRIACMQAYYSKQNNKGASPSPRSAGQGTNNNVAHCPTSVASCAIHLHSPMQQVLPAVQFADNPAKLCKLGCLGLHKAANPMNTAASSRHIKSHVCTTMRHLAAVSCAIHGTQSPAITSARHHMATACPQRGGTTV